MERCANEQGACDACAGGVSVTAVAIIPARGGSRRIPHKNIRDFHGKPIIAYSIDTAYKSGLFAEVIVSTEDDDIAGIAHVHGATVSWRKPALAADDVGTQEVMKNALLEFEGTEYDYACCIYATAPLMQVEDLHLGFARLKQSQAPYVYTVGPDYVDAGQWYWGRVLDFLHGTPLDQAELYVLPADRVCDINTPEDWARAERMYKELHK